MIYVIYFYTDQRPGEPDILTGYENLDLVIKDLDGKEVFRIAPKQPWTHELLMNANIPSDLCEAGADAFLGDTHGVGSTEC